MRKILRFPLFAFVLIFALSGEAAVHLVQWQAQDQGPRMILPRRDGETPAQAVARYQNVLAHSEGLASLLPANTFLPEGLSQDLPPESLAGRPRLAMIANTFQDMTIEGPRTRRNLNTFTRAGAETYMIALAADLGLTESEAREYRNEVAKNFSLLVALGGDDITPGLYGEEETHSRRTNATRDQAELALVKTFKTRARGVFFGICRGHQMGAIADGHRLIQDLSENGRGSTEYHVNSGGQNLTEQQRWHQIRIEDSLLKRFLNGLFDVQVNSLHHQAVEAEAGGDSFVIAQDDRDGITEALQGKNGKSLSVQFHPEFPAETSGNPDYAAPATRIIQGIVAYARLNRQRFATRQCADVFSF